MFVYSARAHPLGIYSENLFSLEETVRGGAAYMGPAFYGLLGVFLGRASCRWGLVPSTMTVPVAFDKVSARMVPLVLRDAAALFQSW